MGQETYIRIASDQYDKKKQAPFLGRDFTWEIAFGNLFKEKSFLSMEEWKIVTPQNTDDILDEKPKSIHPKALLSILNKIKTHLKDNQSLLPFEIELEYSKMDTEGLSSEILINGSRCWIQGDSNVYEVSSKVKIVNLPMQPNEVDLWVEIQDKIEIEGRTYYLKKMTRYDKYESLINKIIDICKLAENKNELVYWTCC
ncbi:MAG: hypothetical protein CFE21_09390 [Bacteroidetes bacterium B1(2017)]|nr:MAG: hypothetical protein CFE21_09390 [Bacteroidetes bacterium B1(2017)]